MRSNKTKFIVTASNITPDNLFDSLILEWLLNEIKTSDKGVFLRNDITKQDLIEKMLESKSQSYPS